MSDAVSAQVATEGATPVLPERGLVFSEVKYMQLQLCKPKLLPIKSYSLEKLEQMEKKLAQEAKEKREGERVARQTAVGWTSPDLRTEPPAAAAAAVAALTTSPSSSTPPPPTAHASPILKSPIRVTSSLAASVDEKSPAALLPADGDSARRAGSAGRGVALTEEETGADAPMTPPDRSTSNQSPSTVSASSSSTTKYN